MLDWDKLVSGGYYEKCGLSKSSELSQNLEYGQWSWDSTIQFIEQELSLQSLKKTFKLIPRPQKNLVTYWDDKSGNYYYYESTEPNES